MGSARNFAGGKFRVPANRFMDGSFFAGIGQSRLNALPQRLGQRYALAQWQRNGFSGDFLDAHRTNLSGTPVGCQCVRIQFEAGKA